MSLEQARNYLKHWNRDKDIIEMDKSTATVTEAANALDVIPARIAKSISLHEGDSAMIIVTAGDMKLNNKKYKERFGIKARMLTYDETLRITSHAVGGVCPFGLPAGINVYLDISLKRFQTIFPACGSGNSAIEVTTDELNEYAQNKAWIDVCEPINIGV
ncbi:MAG: YbaK/EbsC family protein [Treponema sp.]|jgi:prolyl-tRNA editing enzyme YbaK/EbsC (Cys-tRNA(Pro) deacylase)|nr:YbaK/EbsC family protein [Treponema sp.]